MSGSNRWIGVIGVMGLLAGCASQPPEALDSAREAVEAARQDPDVAQNASVALREAEQQLQSTEQAWESDEDAEEVEHRAYLTQQRVEVARAQAQQAQAQQEIERLGDERQQVLLEAAEGRAEAAKLEVKELEESLSDLKAQAEETERGTVLTLGEMLFAFDEAQLEAGAERKLQPLANYLAEHPDREVIVEGHTDAVGAEEYNRQLSERRALAVRNYLVRQGIPADRIETKGYGPEYPVASNDTPAGRQQNRRVDVVILDSGQDAAESLTR